MQKKSKNLPKYRVGVKINYLTILKVLGNGPYRKALCLCDCGKEKEFYISNITPKPNSRYTVSCGCKRSNLVSEKNSTHKLSRTKFYKRWRSMFDRTNPKYICAESYKGITVCKRWKKFDSFYKDMYASYENHKSIHGERQTTLDRINPYKGYKPSNCRWATFKEQAKTTKLSFQQKN